MLNENIFWVGKVDDRDVPFHRLTLAKGTTYNSYLLMTEKPTVIDNVDIGGKSLKFIETPYLHTEETMVTYY